MASHTLLALIVTLCLSTLTTGTFMCYSCSYSEAKDECYDYPLHKIPQTQCREGLYCITKSMTYVNQPGIYSFLRTCIAKQMENECVKDAHYNTCFTYCTTDLCNSGDGTYPPSKNGQTRHLAGSAVLLPVIAALLLS